MKFQQKYIIKLEAGTLKQYVCISNKVCFKSLPRKSHLEHSPDIFKKVIRLNIGF